MSALAAKIVRKRKCQEHSQIGLIELKSPLALWRARPSAVSDKNMGQHRMLDTLERERAGRLSDKTWRQRRAL